MIQSSEDTGILQGWSKKQQIYFTAVFSQPVHLTLYHDSVQVVGNSLQGLDVKGNVTVAPVVEELGVKVGISPVSMENAMDNIEQEIKDWNFEKIVDETTNKWNTDCLLYTSSCYLRCII